MGVHSASRIPYVAGWGTVLPIKLGAAASTHEQFFVILGNLCDNGLGVIQFQV
jgi:hypothetical protein